MPAHEAGMSLPAYDAAPRPVFPATAQLRATIFTVGTLEELVALFALALAEHGIPGHFCLRSWDGGAPVPFVGDRPELIRAPAGTIVVDIEDGFVLLAPPAAPLDREALARVRGYALLYAARAAALHELAHDIETSCGLSLCERFVLARRLAGAAPVDTAAEAGWSVATVGTHEASAIEKLGAANVAEAAAIAARQGWLLVTVNQISTLSLSESGYYPRLFRLSNAVGGSNRASPGRKR